MTKVYTVTIQEDTDTGELYIDLSHAIRELGWNVGDTLVWEEHSNGTWSIRNTSVETKDPRVVLPIDLPDDLLLEMFHAAHERDITVNQFIELALIAVIAEEEGKKNET
jgi:hypothetical protein